MSPALQVAWLVVAVGFFVYMARSSRKLDKSLKDPSREARHEQQAERTILAAERQANALDRIANHLGKQ